MHKFEATTGDTLHASTANLESNNEAYQESTTCQDRLKVTAQNSRIVVQHHIS